MTSNPFEDDRTPSVSFKNAPIGTSYTLEVVEAPTVVQSRDFESGQPAFWPDGKPKQSVVTKVINKATGETLSLWAPKPSALRSAIGEAMQRAGVDNILPGGILTVTYTGDKPNENPRLNAQKLYSATYQAPVGDVWGTAPAAAPAAAPVAQAAPVGVAPAQQPAPAAVAAPAQPTPEQVAALVAAGVDVASVYPGYVAPQPVGAAQPPF